VRRSRVERQFRTEEVEAARDVSQTRFANDGIVTTTRPAFHRIRVFFRDH
jgi:hypothetical protein